MTTDDIGYNDSAPNIIAGFTEVLQPLSNLTQKSKYY